MVAAAAALACGAVAPLHGQDSTREVTGRATAGAATAPGPAVRYYHFDITLPDTGSTIRGRVTIGYVRPGAGGDTLRLDLVGMQVDTVALPGTDVELPFAYDGRALSIALPRRPDAPLRTEAVLVVWHGVPQDGLILRPTAAGWPSAFADNWPQRARDWLPTVDDPGHKAQAWWTVTAPSAWSVVANGRAAGRRDLGDGRTQWVYRELHPIPTYTMVLGASRLTMSRHRPVARDGDTIPIEVWAEPEDSAFADSVPFRRATEIVEAMQRLVGPFPYEKLAHVESSTRYGGMENSTAIFYAEQPYVSRRMREGVVRHETAHQWFGDAVTERDFHDLWLSEGFADYFAVVVGAALDGDSVLARGMAGLARGYLASPDVERPVVDDAVTEPARLLNANSYNKGAWVLHMLRGTVGDTAFWRGIRDYYRTYRDSSVASVDFERVMERAYGRPLGWFFGEWLHQPGYPRLDVTWRWDAAARQAVVDLAQVQPASWGLFRVPTVALELRDGARVLARRVVEVSAAHQTVNVDLAGPPTDVAVDPDGRWLLTAAVRRVP